MRFIVDAQLPPSLADWLTAKGHDAVHIASVASLQASDHAIWASERRAGPQVVWFRLGNATSAVLLAWLEPRWPQIETPLAEGVHLIEVRP